MTIKSNIDDVIKDFQNLKKEINKKIIKDGFVDILPRHIRKLKKDLRTIFKEKRDNVLTDPQKPLQEPNTVQPTFNIPKTEEALIEHFTGVDFKEYHNQRNTSDYYSQVDKPKLINAQYSAHVDGAARISLKMPIQAGETVETQYFKAKAFMEDAIIAFPSSNGESRFIKNTEPLPEDSLKAKCSTQTGYEGDEDVFGTTPERRFELDEIRQGYAEWTFKQDYVKKIENSGIDISRMVSNVINGDYDDARNYLNTTKTTNKNDLINLVNKVDDLENNDNLTPSTEQVNKILKLINTLRVDKVNTREGSRYMLVSDEELDPNSPSTFDFQKTISIWKSTNIDLWVKQLLVKIEKVIRDFYKKKVI